jgi:hypothetical protein
LICEIVSTGARLPAAALYALVLLLIVVTSNHFFLDAAAGAAVGTVAVGAPASLLRPAAAARWGRRDSSFALSRRPERATERRSAWRQAA